MAGEEERGGALSRVAPSRPLSNYFEKRFVSKCSYSVCMSVVLFVGWSLADVSIEEVEFQYR